MTALWAQSFTRPFTVTLKSSLNRPPCRRSFLGLFESPPRKVKRAEIEPGWMRIMQWRTAMLQNIRPPPRHMLVKAFQQFFTYKRQFNIPVNSTQALFCRGLLIWLKENKLDEEANGLTLRELTVARNSLLRVPKEDTVNHLGLSRELYGYIQRLRTDKPPLLEAESTVTSGLQETSLTKSDDEGNGRQGSARDFQLYILALTQFGASSDAAKIFAEWRSRRGDVSRNENADATLWLYVLRGLSAEGNEAELCEQLSLAASAGCDFTRQFHEVMTLFYAGQYSGDQSEELKARQFEKVKYWFNRPIKDNHTPTAESYRGILIFALRHGHMDWVNAILEPLVNEVPTTTTYPLWDVILEWTVLVKKQRSKHLGQMMDVLSAKSPDRLKEWPGSDTLNCLLRCAIESNDDDLVKEIQYLGVSRGLASDQVTLSLLLDFAIRRKDILAASKACENLVKFDSTDDNDITIINKFIRFLSAAQPADFGLIQRVSGQLEERGIALEPKTVIDLSMLYLRHERHLDVMDLLSLNVFQFSHEHQMHVEKAFISFCLNENYSTAKVWNAYQVLSQFFLNTKVPARMELIRSFFKRKRPDMATEALCKMQEHPNGEFHPDVEIYVQFLELLGVYPDDDCFDTVRNFINLDTKIQPCTRLLNALMIAFLSSGAPSKVMDVWTHITHSLEGPSYTSLEIIFATCGRYHFLQHQARKIWKRLVSLDVEVTPAVYVRYASAIGRGEFLQEVMDLLENMQSVVGRGPEMNDLGIIYNNLSCLEDKSLYQSWAQIKYPAEWALLERRRRIRGGQAYNEFKMGFQLKA